MITTLSRYDRMSEDYRRQHELVDGVLVELPQRSRGHQRAVERLVEQLDEQLPRNVGLVDSFDVLLRGGRRPLVRQPDVVVAAPKKPLHCDITRFDASDVVLVVEVLQEESEDVDLRIKPLEYAAAGIPDYWVVALDGPVSLVAYSLVDGRYERVASGTRSVDVTSPSPMSLDLDGLQLDRIGQVFRRR